ncbi:MAG: type VI secretion system baseplate subunit TssF [Thiocapsa sp.]|nr:type VI secretion system baseplate subunit TssF [Thiocapsa sp.]MCG6986485.1 type VI secretion system baseplate subunit TssF [Thiocapsa sp.]
MDPRLLAHYARELQFLRGLGGEFAAEFPKIAGRLGLSGFECADPYVERLLEGFAFLAARVQLKIEDEFPTFTQHLLEMVYPHYLAPTPSMAVVQMQPDLTQGALAEGFGVPRHTVLRSNVGTDEQTVCEYRTAHETVLWPLEIAEAEYFSHAGPVVDTGLPVLNRTKAGIRVRLHAAAGLNLCDLRLDELVLYLRGSDEAPFVLYEQLTANPVAVLLQPLARPLPWLVELPGSALRPLGFSADEALLPHTAPSFGGYRNLFEYFAFPERFLFVALEGLSKALRRVESPDLDVIILLPSHVRALDAAVDAGNFALHCTPAINLFPKRCDRIHLDKGGPDYHIVPDRTRPMDFEVYHVDRVTGYGPSTAALREFRPFYGGTHLGETEGDSAFFGIHRMPRRSSMRQRREGARSSYLGSETYVSLVDAATAPWADELRQLGVSCLCTNRDLPLQMPVGIGPTDFWLESGAPAESVRIVAGPTSPRPSHAHGDTAWRLISHLSLNYLSINDTQRGSGVDALRELLVLYADLTDSHHRHQIEGVRAVATRPIVRRLPGVRPLTYARGIEIALDCDESAFEGVGVFLFGTVLERFFARYASVNAFTETVLSSTTRGELKRWPPTIGRRPTF